MGRDVGHGLGLGLGFRVRVVIDKRVFYLPSEIIHLAQSISSAVNAAGSQRPAAPHPNAHALRMMHVTGARNRGMHPKTYMFNT